MRSTGFEHKVLRRKPPTVVYQEPQQGIAPASGKVTLRWNGPPAGCERVIQRMWVFGGTPSTVKPIFYLYAESPAWGINVAPVSDANANSEDGDDIPVQTGTTVLCVFNGLTPGTLVTVTLYGYTRSQT